MELRDYQIRAGEAVFEFFATNDGAPLVVLPTGAGKSLCVADLIRRVLVDEPREHCLVLSHRQEILSQNTARIQALLPHVTVGVYSAALGSKCLRQVTVAGVQSLVRVRQLPPFRLVIIDECHLVSPKSETSYRKVITRLIEAQPDVRIVGYSATPYRLGTGFLHEGENRLFTAICFEVNVGDLIEAGYLAPLVTKHAKSQGDLSGVKIRGGEFVAADAAHAMDRDDLIRAAVAEMVRYGEDRRSWLVFCAGVAHAEHVCEALRSAGIDARCLFGHTDTGLRARLLKDFKEQRLRCLVSVDTVTTGFDAPCTDLIAMLRPTASVSLWVQCIGRGMRMSPETGKKDCLVLDFASNAARLGPIDAPVVMGRDGRGGRGGGEAPIKICPSCQTCVAPATRSCPDCGYEWPEPEIKHAPVASTAPLLSTGEAEILAVTGVRYSRHVKFKGEQVDGEQEVSVSFRVDYRTAGIGGTVSEWVCFNHRGQARWKAEQWWKRHARLSFKEVPATVDEALERQGQLKPVRGIGVRPDGNFKRVVKVMFEEPGIEKLSPLKELGI